MSSGLLATVPVVVAATVLLLLITCCVLLVRGTRQRRLLADELAASREELTTVQRRLDALARQVRNRVEQTAREDEPEYVITTAGLTAVPEAGEAADPPTSVTPPVSARQFASVALGESLVTLVSLGYGVRRALSAENRNRIGFEMRREVRRSRKQRKRELKEARRHLRATQRSEVDAA